ncbi:MAG: galactokinase, partial [Candidatus Dormibacteraeota bacterium]|nr:galactokinase [Candidatus Dormibacteraeota bacterium]
RAPGRVNLIGEHVDYVGGPVLPVAIDRFITLRGQPAERWSVHSEVAGGESYLKVLAEELGVGPQEVSISATLPAGDGLSSSAALLVAFAAGLRPDAEGAEMARVCQRAEHRATGVQVGIMDQFVSANGLRGAALLLDTATLAYRPVPLPPTLRIAVIDSGVHHRLADTPYNERRREIEAGVPKRRRHVDSEIERVGEFVAALEQDDRPRLRRLLLLAHESLRDDLEVTVPETDAIVARVADLPGCHGARQMGGGFGGSVVALVDEDATGALRAAFPDRSVLLCESAAGPYAPGEAAT